MVDSGTTIPCVGTRSCGVNKKLLMVYSVDTTYPSQCPLLCLHQSCQSACANKLLFVIMMYLHVAGHQGAEQTLHRLHQEGFWVCMAKNAEQYCRECVRYQQSKLTMPQRAPLSNVWISIPWKMIAVDVLEVPLSCNNNCYILLFQDFHKMGRGNTNARSDCWMHHRRTY